MKLIDADALKQAILSTMPERSEVLLIVDNQPEGIVRCKDCKYWQTNTQFCTRWSAPFATQHTSPNWYCADAERNGGDGE